MPASITDRGGTLFNHQSAANTTRQIEHIHKAHRPTRRMLTDRPQQATTAGVLSLSLSHACTQSLQLIQLQG